MNNSPAFQKTGGCVSDRSANYRNIKSLSCQACKSERVLLTNYVCTWCGAVNHPTGVLTLLPDSDAKAGTATWKVDYVHTVTIDGVGQVGLEGTYAFRPGTSKIVVTMYGATTRTMSLQPQAKASTLFVRPVRPKPWLPVIYIAMIAAVLVCCSLAVLILHQAVKSAQRRDLLSRQSRPIEQAKSLIGVSPESNAGVRVEVQSENSREQRISSRALPTATMDEPPVITVNGALVTKDRKPLIVATPAVVKPRFRVPAMLAPTFCRELDCRPMGRIDDNSFEAAAAKPDLYSIRHGRHAAVFALKAGDVPIPK